MFPVPSRAGSFPLPSLFLPPSVSLSLSPKRSTSRPLGQRSLGRNTKPTRELSWWTLSTTRPIWRRDRPGLRCRRGPEGARGGQRGPEGEMRRGKAKVDEGRWKGRGEGEWASTLEKRSFTVVDATMIRGRHSPLLLFSLPFTAFLYRFPLLLCTFLSLRRGYWSLTNRLSAPWTPVPWSKIHRCGRSA